MMPPGVAGVVANAIETHLPTVVDFALKQLMAGPALMHLISDAPPHATPLVLRMLRLVADRTLSKAGSAASSDAKECFEVSPPVRQAGGLVRAPNACA